METDQTQETQETTEPTDAEQEADFAAAFEEQPTTTPAKPEPAPEPAQPEVPAQPDPSTEIVQLTRAQYEELKQGSTELKAALKTLEDRANGSIGDLKHKLASIQAATPAGQSVQFSAEDFAELRRDFPEMSDHMIAALNRGMSRLKGTGPTFSDDMFKPKVQEWIAPELKEARLEFMDVLEPDWRQTVTSPAWNEWLSKQTPEYQQTVSNSWKLPEVRAAITKFKNDTKPKAPAPRNNRFAAAVTPKGAGGHSPSTTEEQEFLAAFNS